MARPERTMVRTIRTVAAVIADASGRVLRVRERSARIPFQPGEAAA